MRATSIPARHVAAHIVELHERYGATNIDVAHAAGVDERSIRFILDTANAPHDDRGVYIQTARRILSVRTLSPGHRLVDATGVRRRAEALSAMGWTRKAVANKASLSDSTIYPSRLKKNVWFTTDKAIRDVYNQLKWVSPSGRTAESARITARRLGYAPPWAWRSNDIDNPNAVPMFDEIENREWCAAVRKRYI